MFLDELEINCWLAFTVTMRWSSFFALLDVTHKYTVQANVQSHSN